MVCVTWTGHRDLPDPNVRWSTLRRQAKNLPSGESRQFLRACVAGNRHKGRIGESEPPTDCVCDTRTDPAGRGQCRRAAALRYIGSRTVSLAAPWIRQGRRFRGPLTGGNIFCRLPAFIGIAGQASLMMGQLFGQETQLQLLSGWALCRGHL